MSGNWEVQGVPRSKVLGADPLIQRGTAVR